jgi:hypothetical protein
MQLPFELAPSFDRRPLTELVQLEQPADLDLPFGLGFTAGLNGSRWPSSTRASD